MSHPILYLTLLSSDWPTVSLHHTTFYDPVSLPSAFFFILFYFTITTIMGSFLWLLLIYIFFILMPYLWFVASERKWKRLTINTKVGRSEWIPWRSKSLVFSSLFFSTLPFPFLAPSNSKRSGNNSPIPTLTLSSTYTLF